MLVDAPLTEAVVGGHHRPRRRRGRYQDIDPDESMT